MVRNDGRVDMIDLINGILGSLVSITAGCFLYRAWEAMLIGAIGALLTCIAMPMFDRWSVQRISKYYGQQYMCVSLYI